MKKIYLLTALLMLNGCVFISDDYNQDTLYDDETGLIVEDNVVFEDASFVAAENEILPETETVDFVVQEEIETVVAPETNNEISLSDDGASIVIPAQEIHIGDDVQVVIPQETQPLPSLIAESQPVLVQEEIHAQVQSDVIANQENVQTPKQAKAVWITLQNKQYPNTFVQCLSTDGACIALHEQQGYVRVQNLPQFAGFHDVLGHSDYPGEGQWRNGNSIPRW